MEEPREATRRRKQGTEGRDRARENRGKGDLGEEV